MGPDSVAGNTEDTNLDRSILGMLRSFQTNEVTPAKPLSKTVADFLRVSKDDEDYNPTYNIWTHPIDAVN